MAFKETIKVPKTTWTEITDANHLLQFKGQGAGVVYWYEGDVDPTDTITSPDLAEDVAVLWDGQDEGQISDNYFYVNTIGKLWVYAQKRGLSVTILEEMTC